MTGSGPSLDLGSARNRRMFHRASEHGPKNHSKSCAEWLLREGMVVNIHHLHPNDRWLLECMLEISLITLVLGINLTQEHSWDEFQK